MYAFVIFALLSVASAQFVSHGVNPIAHQYAAPALSHNVAGIVGKVGVPAVAVRGYGAGVHVPYHGAAVARDYNIERIGEKYAIQNGPAHFEYSFLKGADLHHDAPAVVADKYAVPSAYGVSTHGHYGVPSVYGAQYGVPSVYGSQYGVPSVYGANYGVPSVYGAQYGVPHHARVAADGVHNYAGHVSPYVSPYVSKAKVVY